MTTLEGAVPEEMVKSTSAFAGVEGLAGIAAVASAESAHERAGE